MYLFVLIERVRLSGELILGNHCTPFSFLGQLIKVFKKDPQSSKATLGINISLVDVNKIHWKHTLPTTQHARCLPVRTERRS